MQVDERLAVAVVVVGFPQFKSKGGLQSLPSSGFKQFDQQEPDPANVS
jgi:hypothetical protein